MTRRLALAIGNQAYPYAALRNPKNDVKKIGAKLKTIGFETTVRFDLSFFRFQDELAKFERRIQPGDSALFFFAGHAAQVARESYLLSVDAQFEYADQLPERAFSLSKIVGGLQKAASFGLIFVDGCRDNPFANLPTRDGASGATRSLRRGADAEAKVDLPKTDNCMIAYATSPQREAYDGGGENSPFTTALLKHIESPGLDFLSLMDRVGTDVFAATNGSQTPHIEVPVGRKFFFVPDMRNNAGAVDDDSDAPLDALDPATFTDHPRDFHCVIVASELPETEIRLFDDHVRVALEPRALTEAAYDLRQRRSGGDAPAREDFGICRSLLRVADVFKKPEKLRLAAQALCRADVAVFDTTDFQPGVMMLLGIRSVVRRGVTICSHGEDGKRRTPLTLPFNLQTLNYATHRLGEVSSTFPELIYRKILSGVRDLATRPDYMDLPAYDPVRALGPTSFKAIPINEKILVLCPFAADYQKRCWELLKREIPNKVLDALPKLKDAKADGGGEFEKSTGISMIRLLDEESPRLVANRLYELIRRVDACFIDWTGLRGNVMFELGVRLSVNRLGALHIMDIEAPATESKALVRHRNLSHVKSMMDRFYVQKYSSKAPKSEQFRSMITRFVDGFTTSPTDEKYRSDRQLDFLVYEAVGAASGDDLRDAFPPVVDELMDRALLLANQDDSSRGVSSVLYYDVMPGMRERATSAAVERRVAAWLFLDAQYSKEDILADHELWRLFWELGHDARGYFKVPPDSLDAQSPSHHAKIGRRIRDRMSEVGRPPLRGAPTGRQA